MQKQIEVSEYFSMAQDAREKLHAERRAGRSVRQCLADVLGKASIPDGTTAFHTDNNIGWFSGEFGNTGRVALSMPELHELRLLGLIGPWGNNLDKPPVEEAIPDAQTTQQGAENKLETLQGALVEIGAEFAPMYEYNGKSEPARYTMTVAQIWQLIHWAREAELPSDGTFLTRHSEAPSA